MVITFALRLDCGYRRPGVRMGMQHLTTIKLGQALPIFVSVAPRDNKSNSEISYIFVKLLNFKLFNLTIH